MSREIDRKIAELMGMEPFDYTDSIGNVHYRINQNGELWKSDSVPYFHSEWNAMRLLVEWLQGKGYRMKWVFTDDSVIVALWHAEHDLDTYGEEDTAPLAICDAVLALPAEVWI